MNFKTNMDRIFANYFEGMLADSFATLMDWQQEYLYKKYCNSKFYQEDKSYDEWQEIFIKVSKRGRNE